MQTNNKLREALEAIVDCGRRYDYDLQHSPHWDGSEGASYLVEAVDIARAALAEPLRNCDVGTAEEQHKRFHEFCWSYRSMDMCGNSYCNTCPLQGNKSCNLAWAQMPYEEGGGR